MERERGRQDFIVTPSTRVRPQSIQAIENRVERLPIKHSTPQSAVVPGLLIAFDMTTIGNAPRAYVGVQKTAAGKHYRVVTQGDRVRLGI